MDETSMPRWGKFFGRAGASFYRWAGCCANGTPFEWECWLAVSKKQKDYGFLVFRCCAVGVPFCAALESWQASVFTLPFWTEHGNADSDSLCVERQSKGRGG